MRRGALFAAVVSWPVWWMVGACTTTATQDGGTSEASLEGGNADGDGSTCVWVYASTGCDAAPICAGPMFDACAMFFCGCDGKTFYGACGINDQPFASFGYCDGDVPEQFVPGDAETD